MASEQESQKAYEVFATDTTASIKMLKASIETKAKQKASAGADKVEAEADEKSAAERLQDLSDYVADLHLQCDFVMKNFDIRQKGRLQEIEALQDAKAALSGMVDT